MQLAIRMTTMKESGDSADRKGTCGKRFQKIWAKLREKDKEDPHQISQELLHKCQDDGGF